MGEAALPVAVVNPRPVRDFARSQGIRAKTDRLDALVLARYGQVAEVTPQPPAPEGDRDLAALTARRQVVQMRTAELQRRHLARSVALTRIARRVAVPRSAPPFALSLSKGTRPSRSPVHAPRSP